MGIKEKLQEYQDKKNQEYEELKQYIKQDTDKDIIRRARIKSILILFLVLIICIGIIWGTLLYFGNQPIQTAKPIIYLYPTEETKVTVKLGKAEKVTCSYPKYTSEGWNVLAKPDGSLVDLESRRNLYSLYWEGINDIDMNEQEGFIVKGEDSAKFLEEKLAILGLTEREAEEFIVYWLPQLEENKYNFIRFETIDKINEDMPLEITPEPDTLIRVLMEYKGLDEPIEVTEQQLQTPERNGFVVVEWGGTEIK